MVQIRLTPQGADIFKKEATLFPLGTLLPSPIPKPAPKPQSVISPTVTERIAERPIAQTAPNRVIAPLATAPVQSQPSQVSQPMTQSLQSTATPQAPEQTDEDMFLNSLSLQQRLALRGILAASQGPRVNIV